MVSASTRHRRKADPRRSHGGALFFAGVCCGREHDVELLTTTPTAIPTNTGHATLLFIKIATENT
jgi:hypothetical protein